VSFAVTVAVTYLKAETVNDLAELADEIRIPDGETIHDYRERLITGRGH
jgi:hypothetical protein